MNVVRHQRMPEILREISESLRARYPTLHLFMEDDGTATVAGSFPVLAPDGRVLDRYRVSIMLPANYPKELPIVREVGGRVPWREDFHVNTNGTACVMLPDDRWRCFPEGAPFVQFLDGPVHDFFLGQSLVALGEDWPFGQWSHGRGGVYEYYQWLLATEDAATIGRYLRVLARLNFKEHLECPCGTGNKIRRCCRSKVLDLRRKIPATVARKAIDTLGARRVPYVAAPHE